MKRHLIALFALFGLATGAAVAMPDLSDEQLRTSAATAGAVSGEQREQPHQYAL